MYLSFFIEQLILFTRIDSGFHIFSNFRSTLYITEQVWPILLLATLPVPGLSLIYLGKADLLDILFSRSKLLSFIIVYIQEANMAF